mmetsp:Transcript_77407/g.239721  ORF Transcript_77407/g.239721 Transcript_77407/m.239721 type:complete len:206 (+) Transcript_77407:419-1036(+)
MAADLIEVLQVLRVRGVGPHPGVVLLEEVPPVEQVRGVHQHHHAARGGLRGRVAEAARVILAVGEGQHVEARGEVEAVVRVEVSAKDALVETLEPYDHAVWPLPRREPVHDDGLKEHVRPAVQILGIWKLNDGQKPNLGVAEGDAKQGGLVRREVRNTPPVLPAKALSDTVVAPVFDVLSDVDCVLPCAQQLVQSTSHAAPHDLG